MVTMISIYCAQEKKNKTDQMNSDKDFSQMAEQDVNPENVLDYLAAQVKEYDKHPMYAIRPLQNNCIFVILVNDVPIYREFGLEKLGTPLEINDNILKSGVQTLTYRLYPIGDLMVEQYGKGETVTTLRKNTSMKIEIIEYKDVKTGTGFDDEIVIAEHTSPVDKDTGAFIAAGLPYYEHTITFTAKVPYENEGWLNGQDLTKFDKDELGAVVKEKNLQIKKLYKEKDLEALVKLEHVKGLMYGIANYRKRENFQGIFDQYKEDVLQEKDFQPMEGYQMELYGENRMVTLRYSIPAPPDPRMQGRPALFYLFKDGDYTRAHFLSLTFYLPKGKPLTPENLQIL